MLQKFLVFCAALGLAFAVTAAPTTPATGANAIAPATTASAPTTGKSDVKSQKHHKSVKTELNLNSATADDLEKAGLTKEQADKLIAARPADGFKHAREACKAMDKDGKKAMKSLRNHYKLTTPSAK